MALAGVNGTVAVAIQAVVTTATPNIRLFFSLFIMASRSIRKKRKTQMPHADGSGRHACALRLLRAVDQALFWRDVARMREDHCKRSASLAASQEGLAETDAGFRLKCQRWLIRRCDYFQWALMSLRQQIQRYLFFIKLQMTQGSPTKITQSPPSNLVNANFLDKTKRTDEI
jgi:hypothetical protein